MDEAQHMEDSLADSSFQKLGEGLVRPGGLPRRFHGDSPSGRIIRVRGAVGACARDQLVRLELTACPVNQGVMKIA
jgi:hypothetical protein